MKVNLLLLPLLCVCAFGYSQESGVVFEGCVRASEDKAPLAGAYVCAYDLSRVAAYGFTDSEGCFRLEVKGKVSSMSVSLLGYEVYKTDSPSSYQDILLKEKKLQLNASKKTAEVVKQAGDTVTYYAQAFKEETDRSVGDLLKRLPGIEVSQSGAIKHQGKPIIKFYVEGMDLMGSRYGAITNNLSADDIAKVEIYRDHQNVRALQGIEHTGRSAVNIILKEDVKGSWIASADLSLGYPPLGLFDARGMLGRFGKLSQDMYLVKGNNIGRDFASELKEQAYFGKSGTFSVSDMSFDQDFRTTLSPYIQSLSEIPREYWDRNSTATLSLNHLSKLGEYSQLVAAVQYAYNFRNFASLSSQKINFADGSSLEIIDNFSSASALNFLDVMADYEDNAPKNYISNNFELSGQLSSSYGAGQGSLTYNQNYNLPSFKIKDHVTTTLRLSDKRSIKLESDNFFARNIHSARYSYNTLDMHQSLSENRFVSDNYASFTCSLKGVKIKLQPRLELRYRSEDAALTALSLSPSGSDAVSQEAASSLLGGLDASSQFYLGPIQFKFRLPLYYKLMKAGGCDAVGRFDLTPYLSLNTFLTSNLQAGALLSYDRYDNGFDNLLSTELMSTYRTKVKRSLVLSDRFSVNAYLDYRDYLDMLNARLQFGYSSSSSDKSAASMYDGPLLYSYYVDAPTKSDSFLCALNLDKVFRARVFSMKFNALYSDSRSSRYLQGELLDSRSRSSSANLSLSLTPLRWLHADAKAGYIYNLVDAYGTSANHNFSLDASLALIPVKSLSFSASLYYSYKSYPGVSFSNSPLLTVSGEWKRKYFTVFAQMRNLTNIRQLRSESVSASTTTSTSRSLRGREAIVGIRMSL